MLKLSTLSKKIYVVKAAADPLERRQEQEVFD